MHFRNGGFRYKGKFVAEVKDKGNEGERFRRGPHGLRKSHDRNHGNAERNTLAVVGNPVIVTLTESAAQSEQPSRRESVAVHPWKRRSAIGTPHAHEQGVANNTTNPQRRGRPERVDPYERQPIDLDQRPLSELDGQTLVAKGWTVYRNFGESRGMVSVELSSPDGGQRETRTIPSRLYAEVCPVKKPTIIIRKHRHVDREVDSDCE